MLISGLLAVANRAGYLHLMRVCWRRWSSALHDKRSEEERLQAAGHLATRNSQRRALQKWRACILIYIENQHIFCLHASCIIIHGTLKNKL